MDSTSSDCRRALDQRILQTLMIPLAVVMRNELGHGSSEMLFAQRNQSVETFFLYRAHKSLGVRIRIWGLIRGLHHANAGLLESFAHGRAPFRIPIAEQHTTRLRIRHRERPHDLSHERFIRMKGHPKHLHAASRQVNDEHGVERHEAAPRPHLGGEEVGRRDRAPVRPQKSLP